MLFDKNVGNNQIEIGKTYDSGNKYIDASGVVHPIMTSYVDFGTLPNAATKNVAHELTVDLEFSVATVIANNGTNSIQLPATIDVTNISITATTDLSAYTSAFVVVSHIES